MYYLRTKPAAAAIQFTVDKTKLKSGVENKKKAAAKIEPEESSDGQVSIFVESPLCPKLFGLAIREQNSILK
jgi:ribonucleoside-diphosphate reductase subunit M1